MNTISGWYYLHETGKLIYKNYPDAIVDIRDSDFALSAWGLCLEDRSTAWDLLVEAMSLGVNNERIIELATTWNCNDEDAEKYAQHIGIVLGVDGDQKTAHKSDFINLQESPCGFGNTYLEAMSNLCKELGYKGGKMWNSTFKSLVKTDN